MLHTGRSIVEKPLGHLFLQAFALAKFCNEFLLRNLIKIIAFWICLPYNEFGI